MLASDSCGAARPSTPTVAWPRMTAASTGKAMRTASVAPSTAWPTAWLASACRGRSTPGGQMRTDRASQPMASRWIPSARADSWARVSSISPGAFDCEPLVGSTSAANPMPIEMPDHLAGSEGRVEDPAGGEACEQAHGGLGHDAEQKAAHPGRQRHRRGTGPGEDGHGEDEREGEADADRDVARPEDGSGHEQARGAEEDEQVAEALGGQDRHLTCPLPCEGSTWRGSRRAAPASSRPRATGRGLRRRCGAGRRPRGSFTWVAACRIPKNRPATSMVRKSGAAHADEEHEPLAKERRRAGQGSLEAPHQGGDDESPAVGHDEDTHLDRKRDERRGDHHHAERHEDARHHAGRRAGAGCRGRGPCGMRW